jgi:hypothetical protein
MVFSRYAWKLFARCRVPLGGANTDNRMRRYRLVFHAAAGLPPSAASPFLPSQSVGWLGSPVEVSMICDRIEEALEREVADVQVSIHVEPEHKAKHPGVPVMTY